MSSGGGKGKQGDAKRREDVHDLEQQFILRLPPGQAMALSHELENSGNLKDNLFIDISPENRWGHVRYGGEVINAKLVDLPCITESLKTTDQKTFYKTADISQMLICSNDMEPSYDDSDSPKKKKEKEKKYQYLHGLVPPLKNVRRRRFRKTLRKKPLDLASIEKEVKRLLRQDIDAIDVKFEEITDDAADIGAEGESTSELRASGGKKSRGSASREQLDEENLFGQVSSSEDEGEVNVDDEDSDTEQLGAIPMSQSSGSVAMNPIGADYYGGEEEEDDDAVVQKVMELKGKLTALEKRITNQENEVRTTQNTDQRRRFEAVLDELTTERHEIRMEVMRLERI